jgi:TonB-linked SusC/RagA family outer membrane protein
MRSRNPRTVLLTLALVTGALIPSLQAQAGRISGQVTDQSTAEPLEGARVMLVGTTLIETTNREGRYNFRSVPSGQQQVRVLRIGYRSQTRPATLAASETIVVDFGLTAEPVTLDEMVVTATGEQRKLEVANAVSTIDAARVVEEAPIAEFGNLISGRAAGVQVLKSGGTTGTGSRIRIRGSNSISLSNEPLYYIDGVRMESGSTSSTLDIGGFGQGGGAGPSRINDLNPEDIEDIEVVKGPAAATLYGIQASNGVVRITTKRGRTGRPRWNMYIEQGAVTDHNTYPLNYMGRDTTGSGFDPFCTLQDELDGSCTQTSLDIYSPLENSATRPLKAGHRQQYGMNVSGGSELMTYYFSADYENEDGVFRLPRFEEDSVRALRGEVADNQIRPNALERVNLRANVGANISQNAELNVSIGYLSSDIRFVENDNSFLTVTGSAEASGNPSDVNRGWYFIPAELFAELANQATERFTSGLTANYRPMSWLSTRATLGYDVVNRQDVQFFPTDQVADYPDAESNRLGAKFDNRSQISQTSVDLGATARFPLSPAMSSKTSVGIQFFRDYLTTAYTSGRRLPPGSGSLNGAGSTEARDTTVESRSIGSYVEQEMSWNDRLFVTGALRFDDNSAFGQNFNATVYPKASVSWLLSEEPFFGMDFFNTLRFRAAFGASGQQPGTTDALRYLNPVAGRKNGTPQTGITFGSSGNPDLKPERSQELEVGLDAAILGGAVSIELTFYNKRTQDALIERPLPPDLGESSTQFFNLGEVRNRGVELALNTRVFNRPSFTWDVALSGSLTSNKLIELGAGIEPITLGFYQQHVEGYPLGGFWGLELTGFDDANGDGIIDRDEYTVSSEAVFHGSALPTREASLNTTFGLFNGRIRLGGQFDYRGGHIIDNSIENFRCTPVFNCRGLYDRTAPLEEQARAAAVVNEGANVFAFFEPGWFIKLREVSLTYNVPDRIAAAFRASRMSVSLSGRNLWTITDYSGVDPEVNAFAQDNFASSDFESQPQVRYWIVRLNVGF